MLQSSCALGGICSDSRNFDRGYLDHHWADGLHLLQARSTRGDRNLVQYDRQRRRSGRVSLEKPILCSGNFVNFPNLTHLRFNGSEGGGGSPEPTLRSKKNISNPTNVFNFFLRIICIWKPVLTNFGHQTPDCDFHIC